MTNYEIDFLSELSHDTHGIWEIFGFIKLHEPKLSDSEVFSKGSITLHELWEKGWIKLASKPIAPTTISNMEEALTQLSKLGEQALEYFKNAPSIDMTELGLEQWRLRSA